MTRSRPAITPEAARDFAREALAGLTDKSGAPLVAHAERMASRFENPTCRQIAYLHDVLEDSPVTVGELAKRFPLDVVCAVFVLTRRAGEAYFDYIGRVAHSGGLPRLVKLADIEDHLAHREHIPASLARRYERAKKMLEGTLAPVGAPKPAPALPAPGSA